MPMTGLVETDAYSTGVTAIISDFIPGVIVERAGKDGVLVKKR